MIQLKNKIDLKDYTLILPSVAVGNVAQLCVDLLIVNLNFEKVGQILTSAFIPIIGPNSYDERSEELCTAIDLYAEIENKILVIQIRSPFVNSLNTFYQELQEFIKKNNISKVLILTSSYAYEKSDIQAHITDLRYVASEDIFTKNKEHFKNLNWLQYETKSTSLLSRNETMHIPGGGFAENLFHFLCNNNVPCMILLKFCSEGDNIPDALELLNYLNQWMQLLKIDINGQHTFKYPSSWKYLFGNVAPIETY